MITENNLNGRVLNIAIDFDLIVNTELGLIRFIREKYQDEKAFNLEILNKSDREILSLLYSRKGYNPLSIISTEENLSDIDDLYKSFFDNFKKDIISRSVSDVEIFNFVNLLTSSSTNFGVNSAIAISDELEKEEIKSHFGHIGFVMKNDKVSLRIKDAFYVRDYKFFIDNGLESISKKKIYLPPKQFSLDYLEEENSLSSNNVFVLFGKDYREESNNDKGDQ